MNRPDLDAIEAADHMNSPEAAKHDGDGWYRYTVRDLIAYARHLESNAQKVIHVSYSQAQAEKEMALYRRISELEVALEPFGVEPEGAMFDERCLTIENFRRAARVLRKGE